MEVFAVGRQRKSWSDRSSRGLPWHRHRRRRGTVYSCALQRRALLAQALKAPSRSRGLYGELGPAQLRHRRGLVSGPVIVNWQRLSKTGTRIAPKDRAPLDRREGVEIAGVSL
jgi:hypothetical protein